MDFVDLALGTTFRDETESNDAECRRAGDPPAIGLEQKTFRELGHLESAIDRFAEGGCAEGFERKPELQRPEAARQLHTVVVIIDLFLFGAFGVFQDLGHRVKSIFEQPRVARENAADLERLEEPFVRIERERIGALDPGEKLSTPFAQTGGRTVSPVNVQPKILAIA